MKLERFTASYERFGGAGCTSRQGRPNKRRLRYVVRRLVPRVRPQRPHRRRARARSRGCQKWLRRGRRGVAVEIRRVSALTVAAERYGKGQWLNIVGAGTVADGNAVIP